MAWSYLHICIVLEGGEVGEEGRGVEGGVEAGADISIQAVSEGWPDRRAAATTSTPRHFHIITFPHFHNSTRPHIHTSSANSNWGRTLLIQILYRLEVIDGCCWQREFLFERKYINFYCWINFYKSLKELLVAKQLNTHNTWINIQKLSMNQLLFFKALRLYQTEFFEIFILKRPPYNILKLLDVNNLIWTNRARHFLLQL